MKYRWREVICEVEPDKTTIRAMRRRGLALIGPWYFPPMERWRRAIDATIYESMTFIDPLEMFT